MGKNKQIPTDKALYDEIKELVKSRVEVWPSAYASGQLVTQYKKAFANRYGTSVSPYLNSDAGNKISRGDLGRWFDEVWVNVCEKDDNANYKPCGRNTANLDPVSYPYCRPMYRISKETPRTVDEFLSEELREMCQYKRSKVQGIDKHPTRIYHSQVLSRKPARTLASSQTGSGLGDEHIIVRELNDAERAQSSKKYKKYAVEIPGQKTVYFGHNQYEDYTLHKDPNRMENYLSRHQAREDWTIDGLATPGFWSRWLLWNKPSFNKSLKDIETRFDKRIENNTSRTD